MTLDQEWRAHVVSAGPSRFLLGLGGVADRGAHLLSDAAPDLAARFEGLRDLFLGHSQGGQPLPHQDLERAAYDLEALIAVVIERARELHSRLDPEPPIPPGVLSALLEELVRDPAASLGEGWPAGLHPGAVVGRFELVRELGRGGFGVVWEARDRELGRTVAFKAVRARGRAELRERLLLEAEAAARLAHPNIAMLYDVGHCEHGPFLVMELLHGETLAERLRRGPLAPDEALRIASEIAKGLAHAHAHGVVHRDLKPANAFLCEDGQVKVLDFGLAQAFGRQPAPGGTPAYMAPEQAAGELEDERSDVYALGTTLHQMLAGALPPSPLPDGVPSAPAKLVGRCLSVDPGRRPADGQALLEELWAARRALTRPREMRRRLAGIVLGVMLGAVVARAVMWHGLPRGVVPGLDGRATVAVADFANETSDRELDSLSGLLITSLEQSKRLRVLTRGRMLDLLREMGKGDAARIEEPLAREVGRRAGAAALLLPTVRRLGEGYVVEMRALDPARDEHLFTVTERAGGKAGVWGLVDRLSARAREALGESATAVRENRADVARAVTTSLEAYAHYFQGVQLADKNHNDEAVREYEAALRLDPDFALAELAIAHLDEWAAVEDERRRAAMVAAVRAADRLPEKERLLVRAWEAHVEGRQEEAHTLYARAVAAYPQDKRVLYCAADLFHHELRWAEAAELFRRALAIDPSWEPAAFHLVADLDELGRGTEALAVAERLVRANPSAFEVLVIAKGIAGDSAGAIKVLEQQAALGAPDVIQELSSKYLGAGRVAEAEEQVRRLEAAATQPDWQVEVFLQRARIAEYRGRIREALGLVERGVSVPGATASRRGRAREYAITTACALPALLGRVAPFVESLARKRQPLFMAPVLLAYAGDARRAAQLAELLPQGHFRALYETVRSWRAGDLDAALRVVPKHATGPVAGYFAGEILLEGRRLAEAAASLRKAQRKAFIGDPLHFWMFQRSRVLLATALEGLGDRDGARAELDAYFAGLDRPDPDLPLLAEAKALRRKLADAR